MSKGHVATLVATAVLASTVAFAQTTTSDRTTTTKTVKAQKRESPATPVTLIGCVQKEKDYRKAHHMRDGGGLNIGIGEGDEYVLINAVRVSPGSAAVAGGDCTSASSGEAFEMTGPQEEKFKPFVGHRVEVIGTQKRAAIGANGQPTGGSKIGADLKLFEVEVSSVKEATVATAEVRRSETAVETAPPPAATTAPAPAPAPAPEAAPTTTAASAPVEPRPAATTGKLPHTASPLPLYELASLLAFGAAYGVRRLRMK